MALSIQLVHKPSSMITGKYDLPEQERRSQGLSKTPSIRNSAKSKAQSAMERAYYAALGNGRNVEAGGVDAFCDPAALGRVIWRYSGL